MTKSEPPPIESIPFKELQVDLLYSGRSKQEISANAKELAPQLADGWDAAQPGQYYVGEDGKRHVIAGFTRIEAAKIAGHKSGFFVQSNGDAVHHLTACVRTNSGKPISPRSKGDVFAELQKGVVADDFAGTLADPKNAKDWKRPPMTLEQIAELPGVGLTAERVRQCIVLAESSPEVGALLEEGRVSANIVIKAKAIAKDDDGKQLRLLKKAIQFANADDKEKATMQHLESAKAKLFPVKLIADGAPDKEKPTKGSETEEKGPQEAPESGNEPSGESPQEPELEQEPSLFGHDKPVVFPKEGTKEDIRLREEIGAILLNPDNTENVTLDGDTVIALVDKIMEAIAHKILPI